MLLDLHSEELSSFVRLSRAVGRRADYVQGGGGNTSVKLDDCCMAIKASGFRLSDITNQHAYAVLNYKKLQEFYEKFSPDAFENPEKAGTEQAAACTLQIDELESLRPSVEAGFHAILKRFVVHTHSVYVNLAACSTACREIVAQALWDTNYSWCVVPYVNPGANLTFAIQQEMERVRERTGKEPAVLILQNHGLVVHGDTADFCLAVQADVNGRIARFFGLDGNDFPDVKVRELAGGLYAADTPYLREQLQNSVYTQQELMSQPLYPDQMVFLVDTFQMDGMGIPRGQCVASTKTGEMILNMEESKALALTQTLTAVFFVMQHIRMAGYQVSFLGAQEKHFIANWESEAYRKSMAGKL